jgi:hypothetical protein
VLDAFRIDPSLEARSLGDTRLYPGAVLKPVTHTAEAQWCADVLETLKLADVRLPRPLRTSTGPADIDPTFYWRPTGYAAAVVAVDAAAWTRAGTAPLEHLAARVGPHLLLRAARFRIARDTLNPDADVQELPAYTKVVAWLLDHVDH